MLSNEYDYPKGKFRARCTNVVDGDTYDLVLDLGFYLTISARFRALGINTPELHSKVQEERARANQAKAFVVDRLRPGGTAWNLMVECQKKPDDFGRWLASVSYLDDQGIEHVLGTELLDSKLAVPFRG